MKGFEGLIKIFALGRKRGKNDETEMEVANANGCKSRLLKKAMTISFLTLEFICFYQPGKFNLGVRVEHLLFVGPQLVALSGAAKHSKAGVWHTSTQHWQTQDVAHLTTYDTAGSFLLLGTATGTINYIGE